MLYLEMNNSITKRDYRKLMKICEIHGKLIYRSKPIIIGYKGVRAYTRGAKSKGLELIHKAIEMSEERGNLRAVRLFNLHLRFASGETEKREGDWEGMYARLKSLWSVIDSRQKSHS